MVAEPVQTRLDPLATRQRLRVSRERMSRLLDVSAKTVGRWEQRGTAPESRLTRARLSSLDEIARLGLTVYTPEGLHEFLITPQPRFGGRSALQLIELGQESDVLAALASDYEGLGY